MEFGNVCLEVFYKRWQSLVKSAGKVNSDLYMYTRLGLLRFYGQNKCMLRLLSIPGLASISYLLRVPRAFAWKTIGFFFYIFILAFKIHMVHVSTHFHETYYGQWNKFALLVFYFSAVDGHWSAWTPWSPCGADCRHHRTRTCTSPSPSNGGRYCVGRDTATGNCSGGSCIGKWWKQIILHIA